MVLYPNKLPESERVCFGICRDMRQLVLQWLCQILQKALLNISVQNVLIQENFLLI